MKKSHSIFILDFFNVLEKTRLQQIIDINDFANFIKSKDLKKRNQNPCMHKDKIASPSSKRLFRIFIFTSFKLKFKSALWFKNVHV